MSEEEVISRLTYWLAGLECGALTADEVSAELEQIILEQGGDTPDLFTEIAWDIASGKDLNHTIKVVLADAGHDWLFHTPKLPKNAYWAVRRKICEKWKNKTYSMNDAIYHFRNLADLYHLSGPPVLDRYTEDDSWELDSLFDRMDWNYPPTTPEELIQLFNKLVCKEEI